MGLRWAYINGAPVPVDEYHRTVADIQDEVATGRPVVKHDPGPLKDDPAPATAMAKQVGGGHYKDLAIQPIEYCMANKMNACQTHAIKYVTRYRSKGDPRENIDKAIHMLELLKELEGL